MLDTIPYIHMLRPMVRICQSANWPGNRLATGRPMSVDLAGQLADWHSTVFEPSVLTSFNTHFSTTSNTATSRLSVPRPGWNPDHGHNTRYKTWVQVNLLYTTPTTWQPTISDQPITDNPSIFGHGRQP
jgi:hypothetical protein